MKRAKKKKVAPVEVASIALSSPAAAGDSGSQKVQHRFGGFKHKVRLISTTKMVHLKNSSDLERAPGARSIAAEFFKCTIVRPQCVR